MGIRYKKFRNRGIEHQPASPIREVADLVVEKQLPIKEQEETNNIDMEVLESMSKMELDVYAHEKENIELDRRRTKTNMINEFLTKLKKGE
jgi:hypothetical protein